MIINKFFYRAITTSFIITLVFLFLNIIDLYLEKKFITGYKKIYLKAPIHFLLIFTISLSVLYLFSFIFKVR